MDQKTNLRRLLTSTREFGKQNEGRRHLEARTDRRHRNRLGFAACGRLWQQPAADEESPVTGIERVTARVAQQAPIATFKGDGNTCRTTGTCALGSGGHSVLSGSFHLDPGIAIIRAKDAGSGVFWVGLVQGAGVTHSVTLGGSSIQAIGPFDGANWISVSGGELHVAITAYGGYQISVEQPDANVSATTQRSFSGTGTQVTSFMNLSSGKYTLTCSSSGDIYIQLVDLNGDVVPADDGSAGPNFLSFGNLGASVEAFTVVLDGPYMLDQHHQHRNENAELDRRYQLKPRRHRQKPVSAERLGRMDGSPAARRYADQDQRAGDLQQSSPTETGVCPTSGFPAAIPASDCAQSVSGTMA